SPRGGAARGGQWGGGPPPPPLGLPGVLSRGREPRRLALPPDQLPPLRVPVLLQVVGEDQPWGVVVRHFLDPVEKSAQFVAWREEFSAHGHPISRERHCPTAGPSVCSLLVRSPGRIRPVVAGRPAAHFPGPRYGRWSRLVRSPPPRRDR